MPKNRLTKKTPKFFRKIRNFALLLVSVGTTVLAKDYLPEGAEINLPEVVETAAGYAIAIGGAVSLIAQSVTGEETTD